FGCLKYEILCFLHCLSKGLFLFNHHTSHKWLVNGSAMLLTWNESFILFNDKCLFDHIRYLGQFRVVALKMFIEIAKRGKQFEVKQNMVWSLRESANPDD